MSRSKNARRGTRAAKLVEAHPKLDAFFEELRQQNIARIGAPKAGDARRVQAANDQDEDATNADPSWCDCPVCEWTSFSDFFSCPGCERTCVFLGHVRLDADDSVHDLDECIAKHGRKAS